MLDYVLVYLKWVGITAAGLFVIHLLMPYHRLEKFPEKSPPPRFLGPFSLGQLVQFIIQSFTFPVILIVVAFSSLPGKSEYIALFLLTSAWGLLPRKLSKFIDKW